MVRDSVQSSGSLKHLKPGWVVLFVIVGLLTALFIRWTRRGFITMDYTSSLKRWGEVIVSYGGMPALAYPNEAYFPRVAK